MICSDCGIETGTNGDHATDAACLEALKEKLRTTESQRREYRELLEGVEWQADHEYTDRFWCSWCSANKRDGHSKDCELDRALRGAPPPAPSSRAE